MRWQGTYTEQIEAADPQPGFEPAALLDSDGVLCSVVYDFPVDGPGGGVGRFATAIVRDADLLASVQAWAVEHGYQPLDAQSESSEYILPGEGGLHSARLLVYVVGEPIYGDFELEDLERLERRSGLELEPTDLLVTHVAFETPSP